MSLAAAFSLLALGDFFGLGNVPPKAPATAEAAVVVIRTPAGGGSGFLAELDGKKYIVTNQHVLMGVPAADVHITFIDGTEAHPNRPEIVGGQDLARLELETDRVALKCQTGNPEMGARVLAIGNSLDAGVITVGPGNINGIGDRDIEVTCDFVPGNSGGPILDSADKVLGVATYIRLGQVNEPPPAPATRKAGVLPCGFATG